MIKWTGRSSPYKLLFGLAVVRFFLPFLLQHSSWQLHRDEFLYLDYAYHPDWGFMEVPPLLSLFSTFVLWAGKGAFWVKFWPALFGTLSFCLCGRLVIHLGGGRHAIWLLWLGFVFSAFLRLFHLFQPGFLEVFTWTTMGYFVARYVQTNSGRYLWWFGLTAGLGLLSKYTTLFYLAALVIGLLCTKHRSILLQRNWWIAAGIALLFWLPNLWWQYQHRFPIWTHMQELRSTQLQYISPKAFLTDQVLMLLPVISIWMAGLWRTMISGKGKPFRYVGFQYLAAISLLMLGSGKGYYALGLYPILLAFGSVHLAEWMSGRLWKQFVVFAPTLLLGLIIIPLAIPTMPAEKQAAWYQRMKLSNSAAFRWEDQQLHPLPQDFGDMIGWKEMTAMAAKQFHALPDSIQQHTFLFCRSYAIAGALNFYGPATGLPRANSTNGSYLLWLPDTLRFRHIMIVDHESHEPDDSVLTAFAQYRVPDSLQLPLFRETGIKVHLYLHAYPRTEAITNQKLNGFRQRFIRP